MKTITDINDCNSLLKELKGASAQIWLFKPTLRRLVLRLWRSSAENPVCDEVFVALLGCEHIVGPFSWKDNNLSVFRESEKKQPESLFRLTDEKAEFELVFSGGIAIYDESESIE